MQSVKRQVAIIGFAGAALAGAFYAGLAYAADSRLDEADAACQKAIALLQAAENPGKTPPFGGHRKKAIDHLEKARKQITKAKEFADKPAKPPKKSGGG
jgi:hypothetical protein